MSHAKKWYTEGRMYQHPLSSNAFEHLPSDEPLVRRLVEQHPMAAKELSIRYRPQIYKKVFNVLKNTSDAEEVTNDVLFHIYKNARDFKGDGTFSHWIDQIALNLSFAFIPRRSLGRRVSLKKLNDAYLEAYPASESEFPVPENPETRAYQNELDLSLREILDELSPQLRVTLLLHDLEGFTPREIAEELKIPINTVYTRLLRARTTIREAFRKRDA